MQKWINATVELPELGRPVWLANSIQAWIGWREEVADGDDDQSDWVWSEPAYPRSLIASGEQVTRWCPIDEPPLLSS